MRWKLLNVDPPVTHAVALQTDDEVIAALDAFTWSSSRVSCLRKRRDPESGLALIAIDQ